MARLDDMLLELNALETGFKKTASKSSRGTASFLNKFAEELENEDTEDEEAEDEEEMAEEEAAKEGSYKRAGRSKTTKKLATKRTPQQWANAFRKTAVLNTEETQGSTVSVGPKPGDGAATNAARETDDIISFDSVENAAEASPEKHNDSETVDLIEDEEPNNKGLVEALKEGSLVLYTKAEDAGIKKLAEYGYQALVEDYSNHIIREKIAEATMQKQAAYNLDNLAAQNLYKQDMYKQAAAELEYLRATDPEQFYQLKVAAQQGLL